MEGKDNSALPPIKKSLTDEEKAEIKQFRESPIAKKLLKPHHHDFYVNRWLTACRRDVGKAVDMFAASMKWREDVGADTILQKFPNDESFNKLKDYWPGSIHRLMPYTRDGSPVIYEALGRVDPKVLESIGIEKLMQFHIHAMEKLQEVYFELTKKNGFFPGFVVIQDLGDVGWNSISQTVLKTLQASVTINQNNYPDTLRKMYIVNTPSVVNMAWKAAKLWFDPRTLAKFEFINGGPAVFRDIFTSIIDDNNLPVRLGGKSKNDIPQGGPLEIKTKSSKGYTSVEVARGGQYDLKVKVAKGDIVAWKFKTKDYDITFALTLEGKDGTEDIVPSERVDSQKSPVSGSQIAEKEGTFVFLWDNSYSWTRGKTLLYNITKNSVQV